MAQFIMSGGGRFLIADVVADAVMEYAVALSNRSRVDVVDLMSRRADGTLRRVRLLIGDGIAMAAEAAAVGASRDVDTAEDEAAADQLRQRAAGLVRRPVIRLDGDGRHDLLSIYDDL